MSNSEIIGLMKQIVETVGYHFQHKELVLDAFTRRSYWHENKETCQAHNERMEFLGDAVLGLIIGDILYREFPGDEEGELQKKRAGLVNRSALAQVMRQLGLAQCLRMGRGDELSGCRDRDSILADTFEALVAAIYLDGGLEKAREVIEDLFQPLVDLFRGSEWTEDYKSMLQERVQAVLGITPTYKVVQEWGKDHKKTFEVAVLIQDRIIGQGTGKNKKEAAQKAARIALKQSVWNPVALAWPKLTSGTLVKRYKRFLADIKLRNGHIVTAHCPNSGSMKGCSEPGQTVYLSRSANDKRKLKYTWELIQMPDSLVGVNTNVPNRLVRESLLHGAVPGFSKYSELFSEVPYGNGSRIDILLKGNDDRDCYIEIKNCTLVENNIAYFPDAVTERGLKHLKELQKVVRHGHRGVIFFLVQRMDARRFRPAKDIDPAYARELKKAAKNGVEVLVYDVRIDLTQITLNQKLPFEL